MVLGTYSFGIGDRFAHQGGALLTAIIKAKKELGLIITPVWNKSDREHQIIGTLPVSVRKEADDAVERLSFKESYFVDADHINYNNVDRFIQSSDFFTIDVADYINKPASKSDLDEFVRMNSEFVGALQIPGIPKSYSIDESTLRETGMKYLFAIQEAKRIYSRIKGQKDNFITEISMDEVEKPQSPLEIFFILKMASDLSIPVNTIAPKFSGEFHKGIDYIGDVDEFKTEFENDILVVKYAIQKFDLPVNLKLSVHSGSDKFSIYPIIGNLVKKYDGGLHIKTAGTTWLEELTGLILSGNKGLEFAKKVYSEAMNRKSELLKPYLSVTSINENNLPDPELVQKWDSEKFANTLEHDQSKPEFSTDFRQFIHISYKIAAENMTQYLKLLEDNKEVISNKVMENIYTKHIKKIFD
ncbi:tagaturonate epimerase family protein [Bacteroidota bacterium]